jgi:hypothetical protein
MNRLAVSNEEDPQGSNAMLRNLADGSLMQHIACSRWYYTVLSKIPFDACPLHCNLPLFAIDGDRICNFCKARKAENKWWLCYFGKEAECKKLENAPQFKCSCGKIVCEVMPMPCGNSDPTHWRVDAKSRSEYFTQLYKKIESHCMASMLHTPAYYNHPDALNTQKPPADWVPAEVECTRQEKEGGD